jgi:hypothetical protein
MIGASYWFDEATKFQDHAAEAEDPSERKEYLELADVCLELAMRLEERVTAG